MILAAELPQSVDDFDGKLNLLIKLHHFVCDHWPDVEPKTVADIKQAVTDEHDQRFQDAAASYQLFGTDPRPWRYLEPLTRDGEFREIALAATWSTRYCFCPDRLTLPQQTNKPHWEDPEIKVHIPRTFSLPQFSYDVLHPHYLWSLTTWNDVGGTKARETQNPAESNNDIFFGREDGTNGVLAWQMMPNAHEPMRTKLQQKFDSDEDWRRQPRQFFGKVGKHENGHFFGHPHYEDRDESGQPDNVMFPSIIPGYPADRWGRREKAEHEDRYGPPVQQPGPNGPNGGDSGLEGLLISHQTEGIGQIVFDKWLTAAQHATLRQWLNQ